MKLYAPKYFKEFECIADKCNHSCCIGWEIDVDADTLEKYASLKDGYGKEIIKSIDFVETPHFRLEKGDRCPHLDSNGLCRIIKNVGEGYLCHICREHPRFYNYVSDGCEVGLGMCCEEACRIILKSDEYAELLEIGETEGEPEKSDFDTRGVRNEIFSVLSSEEMGYLEKLKFIYDKYGVSHAFCSDEKWLEIINSLEYLENSHKELFSEFSSSVNVEKEKEKYLERALAYFVYRHTACCFDEIDFYQSLGFCLFCERLLASTLKATHKNVFELARIISEEIEYSEENTNTLKSFFDIGGFVKRY